MIRKRMFDCKVIVLPEISRGRPKAVKGGLYEILGGGLTVQAYGDRVQVAMHSYAPHGCIGAKCTLRSKINLKPEHVLELIGALYDAKETVETHAKEKG